MVNKTSIVSIYKNDVFYKTIVKGILFINSIIVVKLLGINRYGELAFLQSLIPFFKILINQGNSEALNRWLPEMICKLDNKKVNLYTSSITFKNIISSILLFFIVLSLRGKFLEFFHLDMKMGPMLLLSLLVVLLESSSIAVESCLWAKFENRFFNKLDFFLNIINILMFYFCLYAGVLSVASLIIIMVIVALIRAILIFRRYLESFKIYFSLKTLTIIYKRKDFVKYSFNFFFNSFLGFISSQRGAIFYIQLLLGPTALGFYKIIEKIWDNLSTVAIPKSFRRAINVNIFSLKTSLDVGERVLLYYKILNIIGLFLVLMILFLVEYILVHVYGIKIGEAKVIFIHVYLFLNLLNYNGSLFGLGLLYLKKPKYYTISKIFVSILSVILYPLFLDKWGLVGSVVVYSLMLYLEFVYFLYLTKKLMNEKWYNFPKAFLTISLVAGVFYSHYLSQYSVMVLLLIILFFIYTYIVLNNIERKRIIQAIISRGK